MNKNCFKSIFVIAALCIFASAAMAQEDAAVAQEEKPAEPKKADTASEKMSYHARAGVNFSSIWNARSVFGFHVGGMANIPLTKIDIADEAYFLEANPGAQFIKKGGRLWRSYWVNSGYFGYYDISYSMVDAYYLEVPVPFSIKKRFSDNVSARVDLGPYIAFGLFGTESAFDYLSRFDAGMIYGGVLDFAKKYSIGLHSGVGLSEDNISTFYMTFGYKL